MLGLRQWASTARLAATAHLVEGPGFLLEIALRLLRVGVLLGIWDTILRDRPEASPLTLAQVKTYVLIAEVFAPQLLVRTSLAGVFWQGSIVTHYLRPMGLVRQFAAEASGHWLVGFLLFSFPLLLAAGPLLGVDPAPTSLTAGLLFVPSLLFAISVGLAFDFIFAAVTVRLDLTVWLVEFVRTAFTGLLAGTLVPLSLLPFGLAEVLPYLPFAAQAWAPLALYTGAGDPAFLLASQAFWAVALWPLALGLWHGSRERVVAYGG